MTDEEFTRHALEVLTCELGPDGLARFLRLNRSGTGDYTRDREQWQKDVTPIHLRLLARRRLEQPACRCGLNQSVRIVYPPV
ncbi:MAG: hypothetical protein JST11_24080 [Acidobacteria bacterium]|nr:hypothetical protein [Acidobacteriota bacterium]